MMRALATASCFFVLLVFPCFLPEMPNSSAQENQQPKPKFEGFSPESLKRFEEAARLKEEKLERARAEVLAHPNSAEAHFNLAEAYSDDPASSVENHYDKIAAEYKRAISLKPDYAEAYHGLANIYGLMNEFKKQFIAFDKAISLKPDAAEIYCDLGFAHLWNNIAKSSVYPDFEREQQLAAKAFKQATRIKPDYAEAFRGLGEAYLYGMSKEAVAAFSLAIRFDPNNVAAFSGLGRAYIEMGDREGAMQAHEALLRMAKEAKGDDTLKHAAESCADILLENIEKKFGNK